MNLKPASISEYNLLHCFTTPFPFSIQPCSPQDCATSKTSVDHCDSVSLAERREAVRLQSLKARQTKQAHQLQQSRQQELYRNKQQLLEEQQHQEQLQL